MRLSEALNGLGRTIAYSPGLARLLGGVKAALLFSQLWYWWDQKSGEFWKSQEELVEETGLTIQELRAARKELAERGIVQTRYARIEHRLYFTIDRARLDALWATHIGHLLNSRVPPWDLTDGEVRKSDLVLSDPEITTETTHISESNENHPTATPEKTGSETDALTPEDLVEAWNTHCVPLGLTAVSELSDLRRRSADAALLKHPGKAFWNQVLLNIKSSLFLKGACAPKNGNEQPFRVRFDWLLKDDNALKIFEGQVR